MLWWLGAKLLMSLNVAIVWYTLVVLLADFLTGIPRAIAEGRFKWQRLFIVFYKMFSYLLMYAALHSLFGALALPAVVATFTGLQNLAGVADICMLLILLKETISVLQNVKGFSVATGWPNPMIDLVIAFLRLNVFHTVLDKLPGGTELRAEVDVAEKKLAEDAGQA